jgi:hypothetical protein
MLFVRSMTLVMGHAYKRLRGSPKYDTRKYFSPLSYSSFSFNNSAMVLSCFKLDSPTPCRTWREGWAGSPNRCRREACTRDNNNFFGQRICMSARSCMSMIYAATRTFGRIIYINGLLYLLCANHPSPNKTQKWAHDSPCSNGFDSPGVWFMKFASN